MRRFRTVTALLLALIWVPASMCCDLEGAGAAISCCAPATTGCESTAAADSCCTTEEAPQQVGCDNEAETGDYQSATPILKLAPSLHLLEMVQTTLTLPEIEADTAPPAAWEKTRPPAWTARWQFDQRAAPLPHAPDPTLA